MRGITDEQIKQLRAYKAKYGRKWKEEVRDAWMKASGSPEIQQLRNGHGPSWLDRFRLDD